MKLLVARVLALLGVSQLAFRIHTLLSSSHIRVFLLHGVGEHEARDFERLLQFLLRRFHPASPADLLELQRTGHWPHGKPGAILTFDDGLRSDYEIVAPLLQKWGFKGWFFVPIGLLRLGPATQAEAARRQRVHYIAHASDTRVFMTVEQLRELARVHVVGCHTSSHVRLSDTLSEQELIREIPEAKRELEAAVGSSVDCFAWVGGEEVAYSSAAAKHIARCFELCFTTNTAVTRRGSNLRRIERTHLEAHFPLSLVKLQISGLMDLFYLAKRRRVATLLDGAQHEC
jgi:Polysaccharide deacetylase